WRVGRADYRDEIRLGLCVLTLEVLDAVGTGRTADTSRRAGDVLVDLVAPLDEPLREPSLEPSTHVRSRRGIHGVDKVPGVVPVECLGDGMRRHPYLFGERVDEPTQNILVRGVPKLAVRP